MTIECGAMIDHRPKAVLSTNVNLNGLVLYIN